MRFSCVLIQLIQILFATTPAGIVERGEPLTPVADELLEPRLLEPRRVALGGRLFGDARLSRGGRHSCASCHPLDAGGMDGFAVPTRPNGSPHLRNTPTIFNAGLNAAFNWDGVADTLEQHTDMLVTSPGLMNMTWPELLRRLRTDERYVSGFRAAYPQGLERETIIDAIVSFERSLVTPNSRFDRFLLGDKNAMTAREKEGYRLFKAYGCVSCHQGVNAGGNLYEKFGVFEDMTPSSRNRNDAGRVRITKEPRDNQVFRVPSLRNVAVTAPYFHDGREGSLNDAVETMAKAQLGRKPRASEIGQIVDFLKTLTGEYNGKPLSAPANRDR